MHSSCILSLLYRLVFARFQSNQVKASSALSQDENAFPPSAAFCSMMLPVLSLKPGAIGTSARTEPRSSVYPEIQTGYTSIRLKDLRRIQHAEVVAELEDELWKP